MFSPSVASRKFLLWHLWGRRSGTWLGSACEKKFLTSAVPFVSGGTPGGEGAGSAGVHCPRPLASVAVCSKTSTTYYPKAVRECNACVLLPTAPRPCGGVMQEFHCPLPPGSAAVFCASSTGGVRQELHRAQQGLHYLPPLGCAVFRSGSSTACCPRAVTACSTRRPLPGFFIET